MNVLIVGAGKGSFAIRGEQIGAALGARVTSGPTDGDWRFADVCVLVKNYGARFASQAHAAKVPIVWDAVDFWRQPAENGSDEIRANVLLKAQLNEIRPALTIGATEAMAQAAGGICVPHHSREGLTPEPARARVQVVAYEGNALYLGAWRNRLERACQSRGWSFVINPPDLRVADIVVAFRDGPWDGWICQEWKSGVKVVNAIAAGRPVIGQPTAAMRELQPPKSLVEDPAHLSAAFDAWSSLTDRTAAAHRCHLVAPSYLLAAVADQMRAALTHVMEAPCLA